MPHLGQGVTYPTRVRGNLPPPGSDGDLPHRNQRVTYPIRVRGGDGQKQGAGGLVLRNVLHGAGTHELRAAGVADDGDENVGPTDVVGVERVHGFQTQLQASMAEPTLVSAFSTQSMAF